MSDQISANKEVVLATLKALADADYPRMLSYCDDDIRFYVIGTTKYSGLFAGKETFWTKLLKPLTDQIGEGGFSEEIITVVGEGDIVVTESRGHEVTTSGVEYNNEYAFVYRLRAGKILEWRCYLDTMLLDAAHE